MALWQGKFCCVALPEQRPQSCPQSEDCTALPSRLPARYSQTLPLSGRRSDTFLPWPPRQPKEADPSGLRCQANWDHVDLLCARLDMRHSEKMRVVCNPWPLIFTAEWTKDRHRYWPALCRSASHRHMASLIQCSSTSLGARKDPGTHFSDIA